MKKKQKDRQKKRQEKIKKINETRKKAIEKEKRREENKAMKLEMEYKEKLRIHKEKLNSNCSYDRKGLSTLMYIKCCSKGNVECEFISHALYGVHRSTVHDLISKIIEISDSYYVKSEFTKKIDKYLDTKSDKDVYFEFLNDEHENIFILGKVGDHECYLETVRDAFTNCVRELIGKFFPIEAKMMDEKYNLNAFDHIKLEPNERFIGNI